jgi:hypothetical protein
VRERLLRDLQTLLSVLALASALSYLWAWTVVSAGLRRFGASPEDLGLGPQELLVRIAVVPALAAGCVVLAAASEGMLHSWVTSGRRGHETLVHVIGRDTLFAACLSGLFLAIPAGVLLLDGVRAGERLLAALLAAFLGTFVVLNLRLWLQEIRTPPKRHLDAYLLGRLDEDGSLRGSAGPPTGDAGSPTC